MDPECNKKLIKLVKRYECLYDFSSPEYRNHALKESIWRKIAEELNSKETVCKKRWKSLRDTYTRTVRSANLTTSGTKLPKKKYKFSDDLSFLSGIKEGRKYYSSDDETYENEETHKVEDNGDNDDDVDDLWGPLPSPKMDEDSKSNFCALSIEPIPAIEIEENVKPAFTEVIAKCSKNVSEARVSDPLAAKNSTVMVFESLAHKVLSAGLSENDVDAIEIKVASVVYEEITKRRQKRQSRAK